MLHKLKAIVLHSIKYKENGAIVYLYSDGFGRQTYIVNGLRNGKNKSRAALLHPLSLLAIEADMRPKATMQQLKEFHLDIPLQNIPFDIAKSAVAMFISELLHRVIREEESNAELFSFLYHSILMLDQLEDGVANFHLHFLVQLSKYLGFYPSHGDNLPQNAYFDIKIGEFSPIRPRHPQFFSVENTQLLSILMKLPAYELGQLKLNRQQRQLFLLAMMDFYLYHFDALQPLRSLQVMNELFE